MKAISNAKIVLRDKVLVDASVLFDTRIKDIVNDVDLPKDMDVVDANGLYLLPGLIDQHIHGFKGYDTMDANADGLLDMADNLLATGVTGFVPTTVTQTDQAIAEALKSVRSAKQKQKSGARILGAHLEGPYLSAEKKGAHEEKYFKTPQKNFVEAYLDIIKVITLAPNENNDFITWATKKGIVISLGHSPASHQQALSAFNKGAKQVTHLFNGMSGIHHQDPGLAGAALLTSGIKTEVIADTVHINKALYPLIYKAKNASDIILITDCMRAGGMPAGKYKLGDLDVYTDGNSVKLKGGSLAGSTLTLNKAVDNFWKHANIPLHEAVAMASYNPAVNLGVDANCGEIAKGKLADFVLVDDEFDVKAVIISGDTVYQQ